MNRYETYDIEGINEVMENADPEDFGSSAAFLSTFVIDASGSMWEFENDMRDCLVAYKEAIAGSKQADEMLLSKILFSDYITVGGFVAPENFDPSYRTDDMTKLFDAIVEAKDRMFEYSDQLRDNGVTVRGCVVIFTDGLDNMSHNTEATTRQAIKDLQNREFIVAMISFGDNAKNIGQRLGIRHVQLMLPARNNGHLTRWNP